MHREANEGRSLGRPSIPTLPSFVYGFADRFFDLLPAFASRRKVAHGFCVPRRGLKSLQFLLQRIVLIPVIAIQGNDDQCAWTLFFLRPLHGSRGLDRLESFLPRMGYVKIMTVPRRGTGWFCRPDPG